MPEMLEVPCRSLKGERTGLKKKLNIRLNNSRLIWELMGGQLNCDKVLQSVV